MDQNLFFRWLWRFNAVALAVWLGFGAFALVNLIMPSSTPGTVVYGVDAPELSELRLQLLDAPSGSDVLIFSYGQGATGGGSSFGRPRPGRILNYLFHNGKDGTSRWLFPKNDQIVTGMDYVWDDGTTSNPETYRAPLAAAAARSLTAIIFDASPIASNPKAKTFQVYATHGDGTGITKLIDGADEQTTFTQIDPNTIVVANQRGGRTYATTFSLANFQKIRETNLTIQIPK